jgi:hypothetical protein
MLILCFAAAAEATGIPPCAAVLFVLNDDLLLWLVE